jgi:hypothetical protein
MVVEWYMHVPGSGGSPLNKFGDNPNKYNTNTNQNPLNGSGDYIVIVHTKIGTVS